MPKFGRLPNVPVLEAWADGARSLTPRPLENADRLGKVRCKDLALHEAERSVGSLSLDSLGEDAATGERVIVENQWDRPDHRFLGGLLTPFAGVEASIMIWFAQAGRGRHAWGSL